MKKIHILSTMIIIIILSIPNTIYLHESYFNICFNKLIIYSSYIQSIGSRYLKTWYFNFFKLNLIAFKLNIFYKLKKYLNIISITNNLPTYKTINNKYFLFLLFICIISSIIIRCSNIYIINVIKNFDILIYILILLSSIYLIYLLNILISRSYYFLKLIPKFYVWYKSNKKNILSIIFFYNIKYIILSLLSLFIIYNIIIKLNLYIEEIYIYPLFIGFVLSIYLIGYYSDKDINLNYNTNNKSLIFYLLIIILIPFYYLYLPFCISKILNNEEFIKKYLDIINKGNYMSDNSNSNIRNNNIQNNRNVQIRDNILSNELDNMNEQINQNEQVNNLPNLEIENKNRNSQSNMNHQIINSDLNNSNNSSSNRSINLITGGIISNTLNNVNINKQLNNNVQLFNKYQNLNYLENVLNYDKAKLNGTIYNNWYYLDKILEQKEPNNRIFKINNYVDPKLKKNNVSFDLNNDDLNSIKLIANLDIDITLNEQQSNFTNNVLFIDELNNNICNTMDRDVLFNDIDNICIDELKQNIDNNLNYNQIINPLFDNNSLLLDLNKENKLNLCTDFISIKDLFIQNSSKLDTFNLELSIQIYNTIMCNIYKLSFWENYESLKNLLIMNLINNADFIFFNTYLINESIYQNIHNKEIFKNIIDLYIKLESFEKEFSNKFIYLNGQYSLRLIDTKLNNFIDYLNFKAYYWEGLVHNLEDKLYYLHNNSNEMNNYRYNIMNQLYNSLIKTYKGVIIINDTNNIIPLNRKNLFINLMNNMNSKYRINFNNQTNNTFYYLDKLEAFIFKYNNNSN